MTEQLAHLITSAVASAVEKMNATQLRTLVTDAYLAVRERQ
jgi:hypothetical protein